MKEIDWFGLAYLIISFIMLGVWLTGMDNIISCYETMNYHVWICNQSINYWMFHITFPIWAIWNIIMIIDLMSIRYKED